MPRAIVGFKRRQFSDEGRLIWADNTEARSYGLLVFMSRCNKRYRHQSVALDTC